MSRTPPSFEEARNRRQRVRAAGLNPDYWYAVALSSEIGRGQVEEVVFWKRSIAVFRDEEGEVHAIANRCAHRQLKLSIGQVSGCNVVCPYHGWHYDGDGKVTHIPHELFGRDMPKLRVPGYPCQEKYGLIWIFPGNKALSTERTIPSIPELEGPDKWPCVPFASTWKAHHSMIMDNVCDFTHEWLHKRFQPFKDPTLTELRVEGDKIFVSYDTDVGMGKFSQHFIDRETFDTSHMDLCFDYPYQWSDTGGAIRHWMIPLPIDERTTKAFFLFHFKRFKVPFTNRAIPNTLMYPVLKAANKMLFAPLLAEDGFAVEAEQEGYEAHWDAPLAELSPVVNEFQKLTIRKWQEHLDSLTDKQRRRAARAS